MAVGNVLRLVVKALKPPPVPVVWEIAPLAPGRGAFDGRSVIVTGAAGLIGQALTTAFLAEGAEVHAVDIDGEGLRRMSEACTADAVARLTTHAIDVTQEAQVQRLVDGVARLDVLVSNAGGNDGVVPLADVTPPSWRWNLELNLVSHAVLAGALVGKLTERPGGSIVFITSVNGVASSRLLPYGAAKAALGKLTQDLAFQLAPRGVRVNAVAPGWVTAEPRHSESNALGLTSLPVEAIAHAVTFLADHRRSPGTTGQEIAVDAASSLNRRT